MQTFFGQVVSAEILRASEAGCPIEMHKIPCPLGAAQTVPTCDTRKSFSLFTVYYQTMNADKLGYLLLAKKVDPRCEWIFKCWNLLKFVFLLLHQLLSNH